MSVTLRTTTEPSFRRALFFIIVRFQDWIFTFLLRAGSDGCFAVVSGGCWSLVLVSWFQQIRRWFDVLSSGFLVRGFMWLPVRRRPRFSSGVWLFLFSVVFLFAVVVHKLSWCSVLLVSQALFCVLRLCQFVCLGSWCFNVIHPSPSSGFVSVQVLFSGDWCTVLAALETWSCAGRFRFGVMLCSYALLLLVLAIALRYWKVLGMSGLNWCGYLPALRRHCVCS